MSSFCTAKAAHNFSANGPRYSQSKMSKQFATHVDPAQTPQNTVLQLHFWVSRLRWDNYNITKTRLYNFDLLEPHFYIVKLGLTGVCIIFLISAQNIDCGYSLEPPRRGGSNEYPQSMFWAEILKISDIFLWKFSFFDGKIFCTFK